MTPFKQLELSGLTVTEFVEDGKVDSQKSSLKNSGYTANVTEYMFAYIFCFL